MTDQIQEEFKKLLEENNKKRVLSPQKTRERLAKYNRAIAKRRRQEQLDKYFYRTLSVISFVIICYIAFMK